MGGGRHEEPARSACPAPRFARPAPWPTIRAPATAFQESACLQCGLCATLCPERAITLAPRLNLGDDALSHQVLLEEEPFACVECSAALFGVRATINRMVETLAGKHSMFAHPDAAQNDPDVRKLPRHRRRSRPGKPFRRRPGRYAPPRTKISTATRTPRHRRETTPPDRASTGDQRPARSAGARPAT